MNLMDSIVFMVKLAFTKASDISSIMALTSRKEGEENLSLYFRSLQRLFIFSLTLFFLTLVVGVVFESFWIVTVMGITTCLFTFLFASAMAPLAVVVEKVLSGGNGTRYVNAVLYVLLAEILSALFVMIVPVNNQLALIPALVLLVILAVLLAMLGARPVIGLRGVSSIVSVLIFVFVLSFFFPNTFNTLVDKRESVDKFFTDVVNGDVDIWPSAPQAVRGVEIASFSSSSNYQPIKETAQNNIFKKVILSKNEWSEWVDCSGLRVKYDHPFPGGLYIQYSNGQTEYIPSGKHHSLKKPKFRFKGRGYVVIVKK